MKDIVITGKAVRKELMVLAGCLISAIVDNLVAIIKYDRPWTEIVSMIGYEVMICLVLFRILVLIRLVVFLCKKVFNRT